MAFRQRTTTFRPQLSVRRVYETLQPRSEMRETPEAYLLHVYLPGFTKDRIKILQDSSQMVRITGERPVEGNRWRRFDQTYPVPENSEPETLEGKFDLGTLILKMQKKSISQVAPKQEVETTEEKSPEGPSDNKAVDEAKPEEVQEETIPPQSTTTKVEEPTEDKKSASLPSPVKGPADFKAQKTTQEDTSSEIPQKGQEEATEKETAIGKPQMAQEEFEPKPTSTETTKTQTDEKSPKGQEEVEPKPTSTETTKTQTDEKPAKGPEEVEPKPTATTVARDPAEEKNQEKIKMKTRLATVKEQLGEKIVGTSAEDAEKERISKKEVKEEDGKASESRKPVEDMEKGNLKEKEIGTSKLSAKEALPSAPKVLEKEKESSSRTPLDQEGKSGEDIIHIVGNGIRKLAASSSQVVTRIAEGKWNDEEKHLIENIGVAVLVIAALGAYVSYRFAS